MKTFFQARDHNVTIDTEGPTVIIGECINPTGRKELAKSLKNGNLEYIAKLADKQLVEGAKILDVNVGTPSVDETKMLKEVISLLDQSFGVPLSIDSSDPAAIEAALKVAKYKCIINSVNGTDQSMSRLLPIAREYESTVIALTMDDDGISTDPGKRLKIAERIVRKANAIGVKSENIIVDPLAMAVSTDTRSAWITLETIKLVRENLGLNITLGASNISFGLPGRHTLNGVFLAMAIMNGVTCPIANPDNINDIAKATDLLLDRDDFAMSYVEFFSNRK